MHVYKKWGKFEEISGRIPLINKEVSDKHKCKYTRASDSETSDKEQIHPQQEAISWIRSLLSSNTLRAISEKNLPPTTTGLPSIFSASKQNAFMGKKITREYKIQF